MTFDEEAPLFRVKRGDTYLVVVPSLDAIAGVSFKGRARLFDDPAAQVHELDVTVLDEEARELGVHTSSLAAGVYAFEVKGTQGSVVTTFPDDEPAVLIVYEDLV